MATTSPDNLWSPDGGDAYALTTDLAAMQDTNQTAFTALRSGLVMRRGTDAERLALSGSELFEGLHFWTTDTRQEWIYTNSAWTPSPVTPFGTYTPTVNGLTASQVTVTASYSRVGNQVSGEVMIRRNTAGSPTGVVSVSLPFTPANTTATVRHLGVGTAMVTHPYLAVSRYTGGSTIALCTTGLQGSAVAQIRNVDPVHPTSSDHPVGSVYHFRFDYIAA